MSVKCILTGQDGVTSFKGRKGAVTPQEGDYTAAQVGALGKTETAAAATKLATSRTIQTNLASTSAVSFNGTANVAPGITGILPVTNGGTGVDNLADFVEIIRPNFGIPWSDWGDQTTNGDETWWTNLKNWVQNYSTPQDRKACIGMTKSVTLTSAVLGTTSHLVRCIGADLDGDKTLAFQTSNCLAQNTVFGSNAQWIGSTTRAKCQEYYNAFPGKASIKTVKKGTCPNTSISRNGTVTYNDETVFLLSEREYGLDNYSPISTANSTTTKAECTQGYNKPYQYFTGNASRIKKNGDSGSNQYQWERSLLYDSSTNVCRVGSSGAASFYGYNTSFYLAPAFIIG